MDKEDFVASIVAGDDMGDIDAIFHEGACSSTTEWDGKYMMDNNYQYSKDILHFCLDRGTLSLYASSAATYGGSSIISLKTVSTSNPLRTFMATQIPYSINMCAKFCQADSQICGFRYFNVYGPREGP